LLAFFQWNAAVHDISGSSKHTTACKNTKNTFFSFFKLKLIKREVANEQRILPELGSDCLHTGKWHDSGIALCDTVEPTSDNNADVDPASKLVSLVASGALSNPLFIEILESEIRNINNLKLLQTV
jgi:hypothetical protein